MQITFNTKLTGRWLLLCVEKRIDNGTPYLIDDKGVEWVQKEPKGTDNV